MPSSSPEFHPLAPGQSKPGTQLGTELRCEFPGRPFALGCSSKAGAIWVLSQEQERLKERESFLNIKEFACWHGTYSVTYGNDCSVLSQSPIFFSRKWDKTSQCSHCCLPSPTQYASPHAFTFSRGSVQPYTRLTHADGARARETEQVEGPAVGPLLTSGTGRAQPESQLPTGIYRAQPGKVLAQAYQHHTFPN